MYSHFACKSPVTYLEECFWLDPVDVPSADHEHLKGMGLFQHSLSSHCLEEWMTVGVSNHTGSNLDSM